jgi:phosphate transport system substrate-binding protein
MSKSNLFISASLLMLALVSCNDQKQGKSFPDTPERGTISISADESFRPVIEQQVSMYEASFPGTHFNVSYKTEADCFRDFFKDTTNRMIIVTRGLNREEEKYMTDSLYYNPAWNPVASDAIAVIVHATSNDTMFTLDRLKQQLQGKINREQEMVFDGLNATSTVRFIKDSILKGGDFDTSVVKAARNSREVIDYVAGNPNAIGLLGISWIGNPEDSVQQKYLQEVKIGYVQCDLCTDKPFVKPVQASVLSHRYPLVRGLFYILKENYRGLGTGFSSFLKFERGQLIFRRAYLGPVMDFNTRNVKINEKMPKK